MHNDVKKVSIPLDTAHMVKFSTTKNLYTVAMGQNKVLIVVPYYGRSTLKRKNSSYRLVFSPYATDYTVATY